MDLTSILHESPKGWHHLACFTARDAEARRSSTLRFLRGAGSARGTCAGLLQCPSAHLRLCHPRQPFPRQLLALVCSRGMVFRDQSISRQLGFPRDVSGGCSLFMNGPWALSFPGLG